MSTNHKPIIGWTQAPVIVDNQSSRSIPTMLCKICNTRRPRRQCPAVGGEICSQCCGREREVTLHCPLDCQYLRESRKHDKPEPVNPDQFPNQDIHVTETFLQDHEPLVMALGRAVLSAAFET